MPKISWIEKDGVWYGSTGFSHFEIHAAKKSPFLLVTPDTVTTLPTVVSGFAKAEEYLKNQGDLKNKPVSVEKLNGFKENLEPGRFSFLFDPTETETQTQKFLDGLGCLLASVDVQKVSQVIGPGNMDRMLEQYEAAWKEQYPTIPCDQSPAWLGLIRQKLGKQS